jgi:hypothetical protein
MKHSNHDRETNYVERCQHPLLHRLSQEAEWTSEDEFPAAPEWA